jgi:hypothetical protein
MYAVGLFISEDRQGYLENEFIRVCKASGVPMRVVHELLERRGIMPSKRSEVPIRGSER